MSQRKISKQQKLRIQKLQQRRLEHIDKKSLDLKDSLENLGPEQQGLLITQYGKYLDVEAHDGQIYRCNIRQHLGTLVAGDQVVWRSGPEQTGVVVAVLPRKSLLWRPDSRKQKKIIAANIDQIIVVISPQPKPTLLLIDSYLVAANVLHIEASILLNKSDLITPHNKSEFENLLHRYAKIGYLTLTASTLKSNGLEQLKSALKNHTNIFVGQSGVGKSALINSLIPNSDVLVGELSLQKGQGAHTTTRSQLYHLSDGGSLIDSPGIREFGLWHMKPAEIIIGFREFLPYVGFCKYRNCRHLDEIGCSILQAVTEGNISKERWENYCAIISGATLP